jgi:hypothetical protein
MTWFEKLVGFTESEYEANRQKLDVIGGGRLRSRVTDRSYGGGNLELVSLLKIWDCVAAPDRTRMRLRCAT